MDDFNRITGNLDYTHWITGTEYDHQGNLVFVDTPWAMGFVDKEDDKYGNKVEV